MPNPVGAPGASPKANACAIESNVGWSTERLERLKAMAAANVLSAGQIAKKLGVTRNAVIGKLSRLGISIAKPTTCRNPRPRGSGPRPRPGRTPEQKKARAIAAAAVADLERRKDEALFVPPANAIRSVLELHAGVCRYPFGDPRHPDFCFCGGNASPALPYCAGHARLSYRPGRVR